jgi:alpha/beta hydrolase fold
MWSPPTGLQALGGARIVVAGDSAGGGLLALLPILASEGALPAAAVMSPWTDLGLTGASLEGRADADPSFTRSVLQALADSYARDQDKADPRMSPLHAPLAGPPPIRRQRHRSARCAVGEGDLQLRRDWGAACAFRPRACLSSRGSRTPFTRALPKPLSRSTPVPGIRRRRRRGGSVRLDGEARHNH